MDFPYLKFRNTIQKLLGITLLNEKDQNIYLFGTPPERRRSIHIVIENTGKIYIVGGFIDKALGSLTQITFNDMVILNTVDLSWVINTVNQPNARNGYSSIPQQYYLMELLYILVTLTWSVKVYIQNGYKSDDKIIIYGGAGWGDVDSDIPYLIVLNMETEQFKMIAPQVNSNAAQSSPITPIVVVTNNSSSEFVTMKIIIALIGGILGTVIIMACGFLFYRWNRNRKEHSPKYINEEHILPGSVVEINHNSYII
ncbi:9326_t:CDS:2 [Funneliformis geosporum]|nr:9326_t:CDS:2 [Funneliformis geosporum]